MIIQLSLLVFLLIITGLGPGMILTRRCGLAPLERLCTAIGMSGIVVYLLATVIYLCGISWHWCYLATLLFLIAFLFSLGDLGKLLKNHAVRRTIIGLIILSVWLLILLSLVRIYSGGIWAGDWAEHYDRTQFFLHRYPADYSFLGLYTLPARPPMMNLVAAFFLAQVGRGFEAFELCFALLNLTAFLPAALLLNQLGRRGGRGFWFLVVALASSAFFAENLTYTWTKLFSVFYVLLGIALYLRRKDFLAFVMLAAGCLVHYSAAPFALFVGIDYCWQWLRGRKGNPRQALAIFLTCSALLATWFSWSILRFGFAGTLSSTTTVSDSAKLSFGGNLAKVALNLFNTIVPPLFDRMDAIYPYQATIGFVRDVAFHCYQQNLLLMIGSVGCIAAIWLFYKAWKEKKNWFWIGLIFFCVPIGVATHGSLEQLGNAHVVLQPLVLIAIAAVVAYIPQMPAWALRWLILGWAIDFALGIWLQFYLENFTFTDIVPMPDGRYSANLPIKLAGVAAQCLAGKLKFHIQFIGDHCGDYAAILLGILIVGEALALLFSLQMRGMLVHASSSGRRRAVARKLS